jgi:tetratricopeptide (TPR) repeat protein
MRNREYDRAISDFDQATRIDPNNLEAASNRATAFGSKGDYDRSIKELDRVIQLIQQAPQPDPNEPVQPSEAIAWDNRGFAYYRKGDYTQATQDFGRAIELFQLEPTFFRHRGQAEFFQGKFAEAATDYKTVIALNPSPDMLLWLHIVTALSGQDDSQEFSRQAFRTNLATWPGPAIKMFLGQMSPEELLRATASTEAQAQQNLRCQALFYIGEYHVLNQRVPDGITRLQEALDVCPPDFVQRVAATAELKRLKK